MAEQEKWKVEVTPSMKAAREKLANMTPEEREAGRQAMREKLKRYYTGWGRYYPVEEKTDQHE